MYYNIFLEGEHKGGGEVEEEDGEEERRGGVNLIIKAASLIENEEQIKGKEPQKKVQIKFPDLEMEKSEN